MKWVPETIRLKLYCSRFRQIESMRTGEDREKSRSASVKDGYYSEIKVKK